MLVTITEAKKSLSKLIDKALSGEKITITKHGKPLIVLMPHSKLVKRSGGQLKGILSISNDFDSSLPRNTLNSFYLTQ